MAISSVRYTINPYGKLERNEENTRKIEAIKKIGTPYDYASARPSVDLASPVSTKRYSWQGKDYSQLNLAEYTAWAQKECGDKGVFDALAKDVDNPSARFYNPYQGGRSTQTGAKDFFREYFGYDGKFDQQFFDTFQDLRAYAQRSELTGSLTNPGKNGSVYDWAAYYYENLLADKSVQEQADAQWAQLRSDLSAYYHDYSTIYGRAPTIEEFIRSYDISDYPILYSMDASRNLGADKSSKPVQLNTGSFYSSESIYGLYNVLQNGGDISEDRDYFHDAVQYYLAGETERNTEPGKYSWSDVDLSQVDSSMIDQQLAYLAQEGDKEQYAALQKKAWQSREHMGSVDTTDYLNETYGYHHDDAWFERVGSVLNSYLDAMRDSDGHVKKPTSKDSMVYHAAYQYYQELEKRALTDALDEQWNAFRSELSTFASENIFWGAEELKSAFSLYLENHKDEYETLDRYLEGKIDKGDLCRVSFASKDAMEALYSLVDAGIDISPDVDWTAYALEQTQSEESNIAQEENVSEKDISNSTTSGRPNLSDVENHSVHDVGEYLVYDRIQEEGAMQSAQDRIAQEQQLTERVKALADSFAPINLADVENIGMQVFPADEYWTGENIRKLNSLWCDYRATNNSMKLGEYSMTEVIASDSIAKLLSGIDGNAYGEITFGDVLDMGSELDASAMKGDGASLAAGIFNAAVPHHLELMEAVAELNEKLTESGQSGILDNAFSATMYSAGVQEALDAGADTSEAVRFGVTKALVFQRLENGMNYLLDGNDDFSTSAQELMEELLSKDVLDAASKAMGSAGDLVSAMFTMKDTSGRQVLGGNTAIVDDLSLGTMMIGFLLGFTDYASRGFSAVTKDLLHDVATGDISMEELQEGLSVEVSSASEKEYAKGKKYSNVDAMEGTTDLSAAISNYRNQKSDEEISKIKRENIPTTFERAADRSPLTVFAAAAGGERSESYRAINRMQESANYFSEAETEELFDALYDGYLTVDEFEKIIDDRQKSTSLAVVNAKNNHEQLQALYDKYGNGQIAVSENAFGSVDSMVLVDPMGRTHEIPALALDTMHTYQDKDFRQECDKLFALFRSSGDAGYDVIMSLTPEVVKQEFGIDLERPGTKGWTLAQYMDAMTNNEWRQPFEKNVGAASTGEMLLNSLQSGVEQVTTLPARFVNALDKLGVTDKIFTQVIGLQNEVSDEDYRSITDSVHEEISGRYSNATSFERSMEIRRQQVFSELESIASAGVSEATRNLITSALGSGLYSFTTGESLGALNAASKADWMRYKIISQLPFTSSVLTNSLNENLEAGYGVAETLIRSGIQTGIELATEATAYERFLSIPLRNGNTLLGMAEKAAQALDSTSLHWALKATAKWSANTVTNVAREIGQEETSMLANRLMNSFSAYYHGEEKDFEALVDSLENGFSGVVDEAAKTAVQTFASSFLLAALDMPGTYAYSYANRLQTSGKDITTEDIVHVAEAVFAEMEDTKDAEKEPDVKPEKSVSDVEADFQNKTTDALRKEAAGEEISQEEVDALVQAGEALAAEKRKGGILLPTPEVRSEETSIKPENSPVGDLDSDQANSSSNTSEAAQEDSLKPDEQKLLLEAPPKTPGGRRVKEYTQLASAEAQRVAAQKTIDRLTQQALDNSAVLESKRKNLERTRVKLQHIEAEVAGLDQEFLDKKDRLEKFYRAAVDECVDTASKAVNAVLFNLQQEIAQTRSNQAKVQKSLEEMRSELQLAEQDYNETAEKERNRLYESTSVQTNKQMQAAKERYDLVKEAMMEGYTSGQLDVDEYTDPSMRGMAWSEREYDENREDEFDRGDVALRERELAVYNSAAKEYGGMLNVGKDAYEKIQNRIQEHDIAMRDRDLFRIKRTPKDGVVERIESMTDGVYRVVAMSDDYVIVRDRNAHHENAKNESAEEIKSYKGLQRRLLLEKDTVSGKIYELENRLQSQEDAITRKATMQSLRGMQAALNELQNQISAVNAHVLTLVSAKKKDDRKGIHEKLFPEDKAEESVDGQVDGLAYFIIDRQKAFSNYQEKISEVERFALDQAKKNVAEHMEDSSEELEQVLSYPSGTSSHTQMLSDLYEKTYREVRNEAFSESLPDIFTSAKTPEEVYKFIEEHGGKEAFSNDVYDTEYLVHESLLHEHAPELSQEFIQSGLMESYSQYAERIRETIYRLGEENQWTPQERDEMEKSILSKSKLKRPGYVEVAASEDNVYSVIVSDSALSDRNANQGLLNEEGAFSFAKARQKLKNAVQMVQNAIDNPDPRKMNWARGEDGKAIYYPKDDGKGNVKWVTRKSGADDYVIFQVYNDDGNLETHHLGEYIPGEGARLYRSSKWLLENAVSINVNYYDNWNKKKTVPVQRYNFTIERDVTREIRKQSQQQDTDVLMEERAYNLPTDTLTDLTALAYELANDLPYNTRVRNKAEQTRFYRNYLAGCASMMQKIEAGIVRRFANGQITKDQLPAVYEEFVEIRNTKSKLFELLHREDRKLAALLDTTSGIPGMVEDLVGTPEQRIRKLMEDRQWFADFLKRVDGTRHVTDVISAGERNAVTKEIEMLDRLIEEEASALQKRKSAKLLDDAKDAHRQRMQKASEQEQADREAISEDETYSLWERFDAEEKEYLEMLNKQASLERQQEIAEIAQRVEAWREGDKNLYRHVVDAVADLSKVQDVAGQEATAATLRRIIARGNMEILASDANAARVDGDRQGLAVLEEAMHEVVAPEATILEEAQQRAQQNPDVQDALEMLAEKPIEQEQATRQEEQTEVQEKQSDTPEEQTEIQNEETHTQGEQTEGIEGTPKAQDEPELKQEQKKPETAVEKFARLKNSLLELQGEIDDYTRRINALSEESEKANLREKRKEIIEQRNEVKQQRSDVLTELLEDEAVAAALEHGSTIPYSQSALEARQKAATGRLEKVMQSVNALRKERLGNATVLTKAEMVEILTSAFDAETLQSNGRVAARIQERIAQNEIEILELRYENAMADVYLQESETASVPEYDAQEALVRAREEYEQALYDREMRKRFGNTHDMDRQSKRYKNKDVEQWARNEAEETVAGLTFLHDTEAKTFAKDNDDRIRRLTVQNKNAQSIVNSLYALSAADLSSVIDGSKGGRLPAQVLDVVVQAIGNIAGRKQTLQLVANEWGVRNFGNVERVFEAYFQEYAPVMKKLYLKNVFDANNKITDTYNAFVRRIKSSGINTRNSRIAMQYAEAEYNVGRMRKIATEAEKKMRSGEIEAYELEQSRKDLEEAEATMAALRAEIIAKHGGEDGLKKIQHGIAVFRQIYEESFDLVNDALKRNGYDPVEYRAGYLPHVTDSGNPFQAFLDDVFGGGVPTAISGLTDEFKPGHKWSAHMQERKGNQTKYDMIGNFKDYMNSALAIAYQTDNIIRFRQLEEALRNNVDELAAPNGRKGRHVGRMAGLVNWIAAYTNALAGKSSKQDNATESAYKRSVVNGLLFLKRIRGLSLIAGNLKAASTGFIALAQCASVAPKNTTIAIGQTVLSIFRNTFQAFMDENSYTKGRAGKKDIYGSVGEMILDKGYVPMEAVDLFCSSVVVRAGYLQGMHRYKNEDVAREYANNMAFKMMGSKNVGERQTIYNGKISSTILQFTSESVNMLGWYANDLAKLCGGNPLRIAGALAISTVLFHVLNQMLSSSSAPDPWEAGENIAEKVSNFNPEEDSYVELAAGTFLELADVFNPFNRFMSDGLGGIPVVSGIQEVYESIAKFDFGNKKSRMDVLKAISGFLPMGTQAFRSGTGLFTMLQGYDDNATNNNIKYTVDQKNFLNWLGALLFGVGNTQEAREFYKDGSKPLSSNASKNMRQLIDHGLSPLEAYNIIQAEQKIEAMEASKAAQLGAADAQERQMNAESMRRKIDTPSGMADWAYENRNEEWYAAAIRLWQDSGNDGVLPEAMPVTTKTLDGERYTGYTRNGTWHPLSEEDYSAMDRKYMVQYIAVIRDYMKGKYKNADQVAKALSKIRTSMIDQYAKNGGGDKNGKVQSGEVGTKGAANETGSELQGGNVDRDISSGISFEKTRKSVF